MAFYKRKLNLGKVTLKYRLIVNLILNLTENMNLSLAKLYEPKTVYKRILLVLFQERFTQQSCIGCDE